MISSILNFFSPATVKTNHANLTEQTRKFKDGTKVIPYELFSKALHDVLAKHNSEMSHGFPSPVLTLIAEYEDELTSSSPSGRQFVSSIGFGKKMWRDFFGEIGDVPPPPHNICSILAEPCPFFPGKIVRQTHILALIPARLKGEAMTLRRLAALIPRDNQIDALEERKRQISPNHPRIPRELDFHTYADTEFDAPHWILMTNNIYEKTKNKSFDAQKKIIQGFSNYLVPKLSQAIGAVLVENAATDYQEPGFLSPILTHCQEKGLNHHQMSVAINSTRILTKKEISIWDSSDVGITPLRMFGKDASTSKLIEETKKEKGNFSL